MYNYEFTSLKRVELSPLVKKFWLISIIIILILISFLFLPWQQTVQGKATLMAYDPTQRPYSIVSPIEGFIEKYYVKEGEYVKKGDLLFTMVDLDKEYLNRLYKIQKNAQEKHHNSQEQIGILKEKEENIHKYLEAGLKIYEEKLAQTQEKIKSLHLKKISLDSNQKIQNINFKRIESLYKEGIESKRRFESAKNTHIKTNAQLQKVLIDINIELKNVTILGKEKEKFLQETQNKLKTLNKSLLSSKSKVATFEQNLHTGSINISRYETSKVYAKKDAYIVRLYENDKNKLIKKGVKVLYFAPKVDEKALLLKVSDFSMPLIKKGLQVRIMFYGWPALHIAGWPEIKFGTFGGIIKSIDPISHEKGFYYAYVLEDSKEPWPKGEVLKIGTQATLWVRLKSVPIWYQIWRLMNALPPQMVHPLKKAQE